MDGTVRTTDLVLVSSWIQNKGASTATEMLKMDPEAKLPWAIKMVNLTENVKNLNEDESAEAGFLIRPLISDFFRSLIYSDRKPLVAVRGRIICRKSNSKDSSTWNIVESGDK